MSGQLCFEVLDKMFIPKNKQSIEEIKGYTIKYGNIVDNGEVIDEVLVSYFKAPKSYTMENMCEINSHGGNIIVKKILELCLKNGAELAEPGEFTKRAFLNGRIDLVQAESVIDIINAKSEKEVKTGIKQLETQADVVSTLYYNIEGKEVEKPTAGVYIIKQLLSNGKIRSRKVFLK